MTTIGLTGGIGSGKSFVAERFTAMGIPCYNCDERAKLLYDTNSIKHLVTERYGAEAYTDGKINRRFLADRIFADKAELAWIESVIHPAVRADFEAWRNRQTAETVVVESAILFDGGLQDLCSTIVAVIAPLDVRIARVMQRDGTTQEHVKLRIANQRDDAYFRTHANYIIVNDGAADIDGEINKVIENQRNARNGKSVKR